MCMNHGNYDSEMIVNNEYNCLLDFRTEKKKDTTETLAVKGCWNLF